MSEKTIIEALVAGYTASFGSSMGYRKAFALCRPVWVSTSDECLPAAKMVEYKEIFGGVIEQMEHEYHLSETVATSNGTIGPGWSPPHWRAMVLTQDETGVHDIADGGISDIECRMEALLAELQVNGRPVAELTSGVRELLKGMQATGIRPGCAASRKLTAREAGLWMHECIESLLDRNPVSFDGRVSFNSEKESGGEDKKRKSVGGVAAAKSKKKT